MPRAAGDVQRREGNLLRGKTVKNAKQNYKIDYIFRILCGKIASAGMAAEKAFFKDCPQPPGSARIGGSLSQEGQ